MAGKGALYFELLESLQAGGCPLCLLGQRASASYLEALVHEGITDPGLRQRLQDARGLCRRHAVQLTSQRGSVVSIAIVYQDILNALIRTLETVDNHAGWPRRSRGSAIARLEPSASCPACELEHEAFHRVAGTLLSHLDDLDVSEAYQKGRGLCLGHFQFVLARAKRGQIGVLKDWQLGIWRAMHGELGELIRKYDHRFKDEVIGQEADAWKRAIAALVGEGEL